MEDGQELAPTVRRAKFRTELQKLQEEERSLAEEGAPIEINVWQIYESGVISYDAAFPEILKVLGYESIRDWMEQRKKSGLTTHVLDIMGGNGAFLRDLSSYGLRGDEVNPAFDKSLVVSLADERKDWPKREEEDKRRGISLLAGDITSKSTWQDIEKWKKENQVPAFDLVVCRGVDGVHFVPIRLYPALLERAYSNTTNKGGLILSQLSPEAGDQFAQWENNFNQNPGVTFIPQQGRPQYLVASTGNGFPAIGIVKSKDAPISLRSPEVQSVK